MIYADSYSTEDIKKQTGKSNLGVITAEFLNKRVNINTDATGIPIYLYLTHYHFPTQEIQLIEDSDELNKDNPIISVGYKFNLQVTDSLSESLAKTINWLADNYQGTYKNLIKKKVEDQNYIGFYFVPLRKLFISILIPSNLEDETKYTHSFTGCLDYVRKNNLILDPFSVAMLTYMEKQSLI